MKVLTIITSFNRKESLTDLLTKLDKQETDIIIYDDCSDFKLDRSDFIQLPFNYGKEYAWLKFKLIFADLKKNYDYYIFIEDDIDISDSFVCDSVCLWDNLQDKNKISLSLLTDLRVKKPNWTNFNPLDCGNYVKTQWCEFHFICNKEFFNIEIQPISIERWQILAKELNIELSTGVGSQISHYWNDQGKTMYHTRESQVKHLNGVSMMNPIERLVNPLQS